MRQDDVAEVHGGTARPHRRRSTPGRAPGRRAPARDGGRLPGVRPLPVRLDERPRQRRPAAAPQEARQGADPGTGGPRTRSRGPRRRPPGLPLAAVGRNAAARRHRPRRGLRTEGTAHGRALRGRRRPDPGRTGGPHPAPVAGAGGHRPVRHPRHRRGRVPRPAHRRPVSVADRRAGGSHHRPPRRTRPVAHPLQPRFAELRAHVYEQIQLAKHRSADTDARIEDRTPEPALQKTER